MREDYQVNALTLSAYKSNESVDVVRVAEAQGPQDAATVAEAAAAFTEFILNAPSYAVSKEAVTQAYNALYRTELSFAEFKRAAAKHLTQVVSPSVNSALVWVNGINEENMLPCKDFQELLDEAWQTLRESIALNAPFASDVCRAA